MQKPYRDMALPGVQAHNPSTQRAPDGHWWDVAHLRTVKYNKLFSNISQANIFYSFQYWFLSNCVSGWKLNSPNLKQLWKFGNFKTLNFKTLKARSKKDEKAGTLCRKTRKGFFNKLPYMREMHAPSTNSKPGRQTHWFSMHDEPVEQ